MNQGYELISHCIVRKLGKEEIVESFDCGDTDLNDFILHESPTLSQGITRCELCARNGR